jgi:hypothetical protein
VTSDVHVTAAVVGTTGPIVVTLLWGSSFRIPKESENMFRFRLGLGLYTEVVRPLVERWVLCLATR